MLSRLLAEFDGVILTRYFNNPRYVPIDELEAIAKDLVSLRNGKKSEDASAFAVPLLHRCDTPAEAWQTVKRLASPDDLVCVTGSFFLAAEVRQAIASNGASSSRIIAG
jgi:dihydrofolate synthase/folylpolyglutamate synthase